MPMGEVGEVRSLFSEARLLLAWVQTVPPGGCLLPLGGRGTIVVWSIRSLWLCPVSGPNRKNRWSSAFVEEASFVESDFPPRIPYKKGAWLLIFVQIPIQGSFLTLVPLTLNTQTTELWLPDPECCTFVSRLCHHLCNCSSLTFLPSFPLGKLPAVSGPHGVSGGFQDWMQLSLVIIWCCQGLWSSGMKDAVWKSIVITFLLKIWIKGWLYSKSAKC